MIVKNCDVGLDFRFRNASIGEMICKVEILRTKRQKPIWQMLDLTFMVIA